MAQYGPILPPDNRQRLVYGNRKAVRDDNQRNQFQTYADADAHLHYWLAGMPESLIATLGAITVRREWTPNRWPNDLHARKVRDWAKASARQQRRISSHWAIKAAAKRVGMTPRQWYEHGGDIRAIENRGFRRGFMVYIERESERVLDSEEKAQASRAKRTKEAA